MSAPQHLDAIDTFCAGEHDQIRALRRSIHNCNAASASRAVSARCDDARSLFWMTAQLAGAWTFRPASGASLKDAQQALRHMYQAACLLDRLETPYGD
jgi:hypothetical protein